MDPPPISFPFITRSYAFALTDPGSDLRNSILERPTIFQIPQVVLASLMLHEKYPMKREVYRDWIKLINFGGGKHIYGAMSADELLKLFGQYYDEVKS